LKRIYDLSVTTQGPLYPPSEIMDEEGNFVVVGNINTSENGVVKPQWGAAIVSASSPLPEFGQIAPYQIVRPFDETQLGDEGDMVLHTLPLPLPCNNYNMLFAPEQAPHAHDMRRSCQPLHDAVPDLQPEHTRQYTQAITLSMWLKAQGQLEVTRLPNGQDVKFEVTMRHLVPSSLYTIMALRENDLRASNPTRPGSLGVPNCFTTDAQGNGHYQAIMHNPFQVGMNRIINIVVLFMSSQCSHGGAIGLYGLGGDIHAQLKFKTSPFAEFTTQNKE